MLRQPRVKNTVKALPSPNLNAKVLPRAASMYVQNIKDPQNLGFRARKEVHEMHWPPPFPVPSTAQSPGRVITRKTRVLQATPQR